jgi:PhzF family phenazine biosynthesis protein
MLIKFDLMILPVYVVDAFTDVPFKGNSAAICFLNETIDYALKQKIASEMNLAITAFLLKESDDSYSLSWFTPRAEVNICGHATLAASHVIFNDGIYSKEGTLHFITKSGELRTHINDGMIVMDFPALFEEQIDFSAQLKKALGLMPVYVGMTNSSFLVEFSTADEVRNLKPDLEILRSLPRWGTIVTARSDVAEYDFISRYFAPAKGLPEDHVTGSAHCALGPYWMEKLGKNEFKAFQASPRSGIINVRVSGDRVFLSGTAVTVLKGEIKV